MRFTRLRLENWRNFGTVDVPLQNRVFIVGPNASGKSNLLDALRFLRQLVLPGGGFQEAVNSRGTVSKIRSLYARHPYTDVVIEVQLEDWRYRLVFNQERRQLPQLKQERIWHSNELVLDRPDEDDRNDPARLTQTQLEQTFANRDFREVADFFASIHYSHIVPQLIRDTDRYLGRETDPFGSDFLEQIASTNINTQRARLKYILQALQVAVPQLAELELTRDERGIPHLRGKYTHWRPRGAWQQETDFSDGTLRLMGLLWAVQTGEGPLLLEEPELSLHPGVVRYIPQMMLSIQRQRKTAIRQVFISTHSRDLLSDPGIGADEILLLQPTSEGTDIKVGTDIPEIRYEIEAGLTMADAVLPRTEPPEAHQLSLL